jgi:hypothetical protein
MLVHLWKHDASLLKQESEPIHPQIKLRNLLAAIGRSQLLVGEFS